MVRRARPQCWHLFRSRIQCSGDPLAYVLIGGTAVGTVLTLAFLAALCAIWFRVGHVDAVRCNHGQLAPPIADRIYEHTAREADPYHILAAAR